MSDTSQGPGWWQASDGKFYPPETHPVTGSQGTAAVTPPTQPTAPTPTPMSPDVDVPTVSSGTAPAFPGPTPGEINTPNISAPDVNAPEVSAPGFNAPDVSAPGFNAPNVSGPDVNAPNINAPNVSAPGMGAPPATPGYQAAPVAAGIGAAGVGAVGYQAVEPPKKKGGVMKKLLIGLLLLGLLLIGGCVALIALIGTNDGLQDRLTSFVFTTEVTQCGADADGNLEAVGTIASVEGADLESSEDIPIRVRFMDGDEVIAEGTTRVSDISSTPTEFMVETPGVAPAGMTCKSSVSLNG